MNLITAESNVARKRRLIEPVQSSCWWDMAREVIIRDIKESESCLVERRDGTREEIVFNIKHVKAGKTEQRGRDLSRKPISGKNNGFQSV